ncbi:MAG: hypothetical protein AAFP90_16950, partial [Planctomycetota bacterium]
ISQKNGQGRTLQIQGRPQQPASFHLGDGHFVGQLVHVDTQKNEVWIDGAGELYVPTNYLPGPQDARAGQRPMPYRWLRPPTITWAGQMRFDGQTALILDDVRLSALVQKINEPDFVPRHQDELLPMRVDGRCDGLEVKMDRRIRLASSLDTLTRSGGNKQGTGVAGLEKKEPKIQVASLRMFARPAGGLATPAFVDVMMRTMRPDGTVASQHQWQNSEIVYDAIRSQFFSPGRGQYAAWLPQWMFATAQKKPPRRFAGNGFDSLADLEQSDGGLFGHGRDRSAAGGTTQRQSSENPLASMGIPKSEVVAFHMRYRDGVQGDTRVGQVKISGGVNLGMRGVQQIGTTFNVRQLEQLQIGQARLVCETMLMAYDTSDSRRPAGSNLTNAAVGTSRGDSRFELQCLQNVKATARNEEGLHDVRADRIGYVSQSDELRIDGSIPSPVIYRRVLPNGTNGERIVSPQILFYPKRKEMKALLSGARAADPLP